MLVLLIGKTDSIEFQVTSFNNSCSLLLPLLLLLLLLETSLITFRFSSFHCLRFAGADDGNCSVYIDERSGQRWSSNAQSDSTRLDVSSRHFDSWPKSSTDAPFPSPPLNAWLRWRSTHIGGRRGLTSTNRCSLPLLPHHPSFTCTSCPRMRTSLSRRCVRDASYPAAAIESC